METRSLNINYNNKLCGSYMFEFSVGKDVKKKNNNDKISAYLLALCLILIVKELKIRVEYGRVVTTLNMIKDEISFLV